MIKAPSLWPRLLALLVFLIAVNLLSGFIAVTLNYPSLFNVNASFSEYAAPFSFTWALAHWPSLLLYGIPLLFHTRTQEKLVLYYRLFCGVSFCLLMLELDAKVPFLLFPKVDAMTGLLLSLTLVAPTRSANPVLFPVVCAAGAAVMGVVVFFAYSHWQHRTPELNRTLYADRKFELTAIDVDKERHEMRVVMDLTVRMDVIESCKLGQQVAEQVTLDYPFDPSYNKLIEVWFNPATPDLKESHDDPYRLGEISLNETDRDSDGKLACYLSYR
jgi:hypothetical protein